MLAAPAKAVISGPFAGVSVEVAPEGGAWVMLCGSLTPGLAGEFECLWDTASGGYSDGGYLLRAKLSGGSPGRNADDEHGGRLSWITRLRQGRSQRLRRVLRVASRW